MVSAYGCSTKKVLKTKVGEIASAWLQETSMFGPEIKPGASLVVVGPGPYERKWYATVVVGADGRIVKVS